MTNDLDMISPLVLILNAYRVRDVINVREKSPSVLVKSFPGSAG